MPSVTFEGRFDMITGAGLAPLPVQRPIPIWLGGSSDPACQRMGQLADGGFPQVPPGERLDRALETIAEAATQAGRDPAATGMEGRASHRGREVGEVVEHLHRWREAGATHVSLNTMGAGFEHVSQHLAVLAEIGARLGL